LGEWCVVREVDMSVIALGWISHIWARFFPRSRTLSITRFRGTRKDDWEVVYVAANELEGEIVRGRLESEGIPAVLKGEALGRVYGMVVGPLAQVEVLVPPPLVERAHALLSEMNDEEEEEEIPTAEIT